MQSAIVAFTAIGTGVALAVSGALDVSDRVSVDSGTISTQVPNNAPAPDQVMTDYLTAFRDWNSCVRSLPGDASPAERETCGTRPRQPDDPVLNVYLAQVLDWNKCASPRLRRGGLEAAIEACGPQPISPLAS